MLPYRWRTPLAQLSRYAIASGLAMALDWTIFLSLVGAAARPATAGVLGYVAGVALHYVLSVRFVFDAAATQKGSARLCTKFAFSGLAGVAVTGSSIAIATQLLGLSAVPGKLCAMSASFAAVYSLRRGAVFARRAEPQSCAAKVRPFSASSAFACVRLFFTGVGVSTEVGVSSACPRPGAGRP